MMFVLDPCTFQHGAFANAGAVLQTVPRLVGRPDHRCSGALALQGASRGTGRTGGAVSSTDDAFGNRGPCQKSGPRGFTMSLYRP